MFRVYRVIFWLLNPMFTDRGVEEEPVVDNTQTRDPGVPPQTREVMPPPGQTLDLMGPPPPGSGDPDGGDGYDGESAEEEENMEDEDDDSDESEGEAEMVLDPNHVSAHGSCQF